MTVTDSRLNIHEKRIIKAIEDSMPDGIHVQGMVKKFGISPTTLKQHLPVLENERKIIFHEKIKNKDVYKIRLHDEFSFEETRRTLAKSLHEFEIASISAINNSQDWGISERMEMYQNIANVISLLRYLHQFVIDTEKYDEKSIPNDIVKSIQKLDDISKMVNSYMNPLLHQFFMIQINNSVSESLDYLKSIPTRKKGKQSKYINKVLGEMKLNPKVFSIVNNADKEIKKVSRIRKKNKSKN